MYQLISDEPNKGHFEDTLVELLNSGRPLVVVSTSEDLRDGDIDVLIKTASDTDLILMANALNKIVRRDEIEDAMDCREFEDWEGEIQDYDDA